MKRYKKVLSLAMAASLTAIFPMQTLADNPEFAHDEATWARLRDNVIEYDELQMLVEEYNPTYLNNQTTYRDTKDNEDVEERRQKKYESAMDAYDSADNLREQAEDLLDMGAAPAYASLISLAIMTEESALQTEQAADSLYTDSEMDRLKYIGQQDALVVQTQKQFQAYNQMKKTLVTVERGIALKQADYEALERKAGLGLATQAELLTAKKNLQSMQSTYTQTQSSLENMRQMLCLMTGWNYNDQPEIQDTPKPDLNRIALMNPEIDKQTALDSNYDLKYNRRSYDNMKENSADKKNMERTIKNQESNIKAKIQTMYSDVLQKKLAYEVAQAALESETVSMQSAETKYQLGMIPRLDYLKAQAAFSDKQVEEGTAEMELFQAIEAYDWALKGYMAG